MSILITLHLQYTYSYREQMTGPRSNIFLHTFPSTSQPMFIKISNVLDLRFRGQRFESNTLASSYVKRAGVVAATTDRTDRQDVNGVLNTSLHIRNQRTYLLAQFKWEDYRRRSYKVVLMLYFLLVYCTHRLLREQILIICNSCLLEQSYLRQCTSDPVGYLKILIWIVLNRP